MENLCAKNDALISAFGENRYLFLGVADDDSPYNLVCMNYETSEVVLVNRVAVKRPEILDADGVPIHVGDTVWATDPETLMSGAVSSVFRGNVSVKWKDDVETFKIDPEDLTHREPDSEERVKQDAMHGSKAYCKKYGLTPEWDDGNPVFEYVMVEHIMNRLTAIMERDA